VARVAAGAVAKLLLHNEGIHIFSYVSAVGAVKLEKDYTQLDLDATEDNIIRCPDAETAEKMIAFIEGIRKSGDTAGGIITGVIKGCPAGLGEPVFDKLHADLAKAMLSINATKGFEYGSGFAGTLLKGSEHNDVFEQHKGEVSTRTNHSGGIQGGISNGMDIYFNVAFKPIATLMRDQESITEQGESTIIQGKGRHDPCVLPRAVPIVEAMAALVIADHLLRNKTARL
jgi:chorismate synthase